MFYQYAKYVVQNMVAHMHGNSCLCKPRLHTIQAFATFQCIIDKSTDYMSYRSYILASDKKVVAKVFQATWTWKETVLELNQINISLEIKKILYSNLRKSKGIVLKSTIPRLLRIILLTVLVVINIIHLGIPSI